MRFRRLLVEGDKKHEKLHNLEPVLWQSHHVSEIFMEFWSQKSLDGCQQLTLFLRRPEPHEKKYLYSEFFGTSYYFIEQNDIDRKVKLKGRELEKYYLQIITESLFDIAERCGNIEIIEDIKSTSKKVKENNFEYTKKITRLSKNSPDKKCKVNIYRELKYMGEWWYAEIVYKDGRIIKKYLNDIPAHITKEEFYKKAEWQDQKFCVLDRFGVIVWEISI